MFRYAYPDQLSFSKDSHAQRLVVCRDWMRASGASLSRLDQVRPNVYTMGAQDPRTLRAGSARRRRSSGRQPGSTPYQQIDTEPPLAGITYQKTAWGSQTSIPELIRQQSERQRPQSGRRPWSGRGVPPPPQRKDSREQPPPPRAPGGLIAVLGEKYSPSERPPSGVATHNTSTWVPRGRGAKDEDAEDTDRIIQEILSSQDQTDKSLAKMTRLYGEGEPPPPPRGSPDLEQMIKDLPSQSDLQQGSPQQDGSEGQQEPTTEILVRQAPVPPTVPLLRRPAPEPIRFAIPTGDEDEGNGDDSDEDHRRISTSSKEVTKDVDIVSITSDTSSPRLLPSTSTALHAQGTDEQTNVARKLNVTINEGQNVLINITPRDIASSDGNTEPPSRRPRSATVERKPDTSLQSLQEELGLTAKDERQRTASPRGVRSAVKSPRLVKRRVKSAKARLDVRTVSVEYGEERDEDKDEKEEEKTTAENELKKRRRRRPDEVETMVSRIPISDSEEHQSSQFVATNEGRTETRKTQVSSVNSNRNYYQLSLQQSEKYKTVKTIEFADGGPSETKTKTLISVTERPEGVRSGVWDVGAGEGKENHLGIKRPMSAQRIVSRPPPRPECRQGYYADMDRPQLETPEQAVDIDLEPPRSPSALQQAMALNQKPPRPHSAKVPSRGLAKSPRKHSHRRPRSATVGSTGAKKEEKAVSRALVPAAPKPSTAELRRNRAAVKALKAGTLCKEKAYIAPSPPVQAVKPIVRKTNRRKDSSSSDEELVEKMLLARQEDVNETNTPRTAECKDIYDRLQEKGVVVSMDTIKKGLIPPEEKTFSECTSKLPTNTTTSLLSSPEVWLSTEFKRLRLAEKAVELANERLAQQQREERGETDKAKAKKKKKTPSGSKKKHKRSATTS
ncbi:PREDICTED: serine/arginine repetitive matrix protein 1-like isoform X1 [Branchiostoma belcheri]|uniref:Serine/arginine repetitive matrix protein 1-like isoform X1 n=1 Tax=Branchiostoma belcheri TaxID=7741 RepID=A0A6P4YFQ7_BRABE|nr:PREDICTED: serine/arginine repetitive matrix protein 1-like isoform X1 [Branchiostoma belcheri]